MVFQADSLKNIIAADYRKRTTYMHRNRKPCNFFHGQHGEPFLYLMPCVVCTTWQPYSNNMLTKAAGLQPTSIGYPYYAQLTPVKTKFLLTSITSPYCGLRFSSLRSRPEFFLSLLLTMFWFLIGLQEKACRHRLTYCNQELHF